MHEYFPQSNEKSIQENDQFLLNFNVEKIDNLAERRGRVIFPERKPVDEIDGLKIRFKQEALPGQDFASFLIDDAKKKIDHQLHKE